jgi:hypothetical protein
MGTRFADRDMIMRFCGLGPGHRAFWEAIKGLRDMVRSAFGLGVNEDVSDEDVDADEMVVDEEEGEDEDEDESADESDRDSSECEDDEESDASDSDLDDDEVTPEDDLGYAAL